MLTVEPELHPSGAELHRPVDRAGADERAAGELPDLGLPAAGHRPDEHAVPPAEVAAEEGAHHLHPGGAQVDCGQLRAGPLTSMNPSSSRGRHRHQAPWTPTCNPPCNHLRTHAISIGLTAGFSTGPSTGLSTGNLQHPSLAHPSGRALKSP